ncbi:class I histocompatibility antigen, F10 alpha chain-like isoform X1 [Phaenicophaeus curvirostris]|uniref:class I histocompatibility antigen, F10 alpha chain-like isoform X1 n=1 Tax=Phaenicophaeus curvirostris TaxID=33595 RepID=UPI0037F0B8B0
MASGWAAAPGLLLAVLGGVASGLHSLHYFHVAVTHPSPGVPEFVVVGYVDGNLIVRYDSESRRAVPRADWVKANLGQQHWDTESEAGQRHQEINRIDLDTLRQRYNQSGGVHTVQRMHGCDLLENNGTKGYLQFAYDGKDFISWDMDSMTFIAADAGAVATKINWEKDGMEAERLKNYMENMCIPALKVYVSYGQSVLERKEPPTVRVSGKKAGEFLTLRCRVYGFYPRGISVSWLRDNDPRDQDTTRSGIVPNSDGTFYTAASIVIRPEEKAKYRCRVEHPSLAQPGLYAWDESAERGADNVLLIVGAVVAAVLLVGVAGIAFWKLQSGKQEERYTRASSADTGIGSSGEQRGLNVSLAGGAGEGLELLAEKDCAATAPGTV